MVKKNWLILGTFLLLVGGLFWMIQRRQVVVNQPVAETPTQSELGAVIDTSDWKIYRNAEYGFEFKYPKDWKIEKNSGVNVDPSVVSITSPETTELNKKCYESCGPDISFYFYPSIKNEPANESLKAESLGEFIEKDEFTRKIGTRKIGELEMTEVIQGGSGAYYVLLGEKNGAIYKIFFTHIDLEEALRTVDTAIIESFRVQK